MNDNTLYEHKFTGERLTGIQLDPSGSGYVPTHWNMIVDHSMDGELVTWTPRPEWGESPVSSGIVRQVIRGADGLTYVVKAGDKLVHVHSSRIEGI